MVNFRCLVPAALVLLLGGLGQARAGLIGSTVDVEGYSPNLNTQYQNFGQQTVNPTATFALGNNENTTISNTQIIYTGPPGSGTYGGGSFNGFVYDFLESGNLISGVTIDAATTLSGFNLSDLTLASDGAGGQSVELNVAGLSFNADDSVVLDVTTNSVPEPSSLIMLSLPIIGILVYCRLRRAVPVAA